MAKARTRNQAWVACSPHTRHLAGQGRLARENEGALSAERTREPPAAGCTCCGFCSRVWYCSSAERRRRLHEGGLPQMYGRRLSLFRGLAPHGQLAGLHGVVAPKTQNASSLARRCGLPLSSFDRFLKSPLRSSEAGGSSPGTAARRSSSGHREPYRRKIARGHPPTRRPEMRATGRRSVSERPLASGLPRPPL